MKTNRIVALLAVLCLITTCFVGTTLAKYTTTAEGADTARVAKFGVVLSAGSDIFKPKYDADDAISVLADDMKDVVAPGTAGTMTAFTIAGAPEVDVNVSISLDVDDKLSMITLPAGEYNDYTTAVTTDKYTVPAENYYPVVWTLKKDGVDVVSGNLEAIEAELASMSKKYEVEAATGGFADLVGNWTLDWAWDFDANDQADTTLGQIAANVAEAVAEAPGAVLNETYSFKISVTQVD